MGESVDCLLLIADKAWLHPGWEDTMQRWWNWQQDKKKDEAPEACQSKDCHCGGRSRFFCRKSRNQQLGEEDCECWQRREEKGKSERGIGNATWRCKIWRMSREGSRSLKLEEGLPKVFLLTFFEQAAQRYKAASP